MDTPLKQGIKRNWQWFSLVLILGMAVWLRVFMVSETQVLVPIKADALDYFLAACNVKTFGVYSKSLQPLEGGGGAPPAPDALRPPGYSLFLLPFVEFPPTAAMVRNVQIAQVLLSVLLIPLLFVAIRPFLSPALALGVLAAIAISPHLVAMNVYLLTESLFTFLIGTLVWAFSHAARRPDKKALFMVGVVVGLTSLVRSTTLYLPLVLALLIMALWWADRRKGALLAAMMMLGFFVSYSPWLVRNQIVRLEKTRSLAVDSIHKGMYPWLMYQNNPKTLGVPDRYDPAWNETGASLALVVGEINRNFHADPGGYVQWYLVGKPIMYLSWNALAGMGDVFVYQVIRSPMLTEGAFLVSHDLSKLLHWLFVVMAVLGMLFVLVPSVAATLKKEEYRFYLFNSVLLAYFVAIHTIGTPLPRYSIPMRPILFILAFGFLHILLLKKNRTNHGLFWQ